MFADLRDPGRLQVLGSGMEHGQEAPHNHVVELLLGVVELLWRLLRRNDGEVVRNLRVVEYASVGLHPTLLQDALGDDAVVLRLAQDLHRLLHRREIVLGKRTRIRARVCKHLVPLVKRLRERKRHLGGKAKSAICFALQTREIKK